MNLRIMWRSLYQLLKGVLANCKPLSLTSVLGVPNRLRIIFHINFIILWSLIDATGVAATHIVK